MNPFTMYIVFVFLYRDHVCLADASVSLPMPLFFSCLYYRTNIFFVSCRALTLLAETLVCPANTSLSISNASGAPVCLAKDAVCLAMANVCLAKACEYFVEAHVCLSDIPITHVLLAQACVSC